MLKTAILISGRGSNMKALIDAARQPGYPARIAVVVSNIRDAEGLAIARAAGIPIEVINHRSYLSREEFERELDAKLNQYGVQMVCLAGFMRILTSWFVDRWRDRLINIHPSLLPAYPGLDTHKRALEAGDKQAGCTVHFVRADVDHGPIIAQAAVPVEPGDTEETLAARVLKEEHRIYPQTLRMIAEGRVNVFEEHVLITGADAPAQALANPR
ncbi:MAG: phosphoribosylglycinamide formyltransferase [Bdellovibrionales bacterium]